MGEKTNISWCDSSCNPSSGCDGCELFSPAKPDEATCYAKAIHENRLRFGHPGLYSMKFSDVKLIPGRMFKAACWPDLRGKERPEKPWLNGLPRCIFVGDMTDIFSKAVPDDYLRDEVFKTMWTGAGRRHFWMVLTKRPERLAKFSEKNAIPDNCICMTSITSQKTADARLPWLMQVKARYRGISAEPLLSSVALPACAFDYSYKAMTANFQWIIIGGESGIKRRDCGIEAIEGLARGMATLTPTFVKQDSARYDGERGRIGDEIWKLKQMPKIA